MKKIMAALLLLATAARAQDQKPYDMMVNGVKVIVIPSGNDIVQIDLVIKGGLQNYGAGKAGIEKMAMTALTECGTAKRSKNDFKNALDEVDARMNAYTDRDAAHVQLNCIKSDFETVWPLYAEAVTLPKFDPKEFARIKEEAINQLREEESNPDAALQKMAMQTVFKGQDYAKMPGGTMATLATLTPEATKAYLNSILTRSHIFIVVVGDITKEDLQNKIGALLAKVPQGKPFELKRSAYKPPSNTFVAEKKDVATNYILGLSGAPETVASKEYFAGRLASDLFYDKTFLEVRTNNGLSYAPAAFIINDLTSYSGLYVTTKEPDKYIAVARNLIDKIKKEGFPAADVQNMKNTRVTYQYYRSETNQSLAAVVASMQLRFNDWHHAFTAKEDVKDITPSDVNNVFNKYIGNFTWVYQGDPTKVNATLYTQKETPPLPEKKKAF